MRKKNILKYVNYRYSRFLIEYKARSWLEFDIEILENNSSIEKKKTKKGNIEVMRLFN
jgi:hypothetical protein